MYDFHSNNIHITVLKNNQITYFGISKMGLYRDFKDTVYVGSSIALIVLAVLEIISLIVATVIILRIQSGDNPVDGIVAFIYWLVAWLLQQIYVIPITEFVKRANRWSR